MGIGDWGLGIGDWAQSPIPNPQSPYTFSNLHSIIKYINFISFSKLNFYKKMKKNPKEIVPEL
jgi:hypothetical protein